MSPADAAAVQQLGLLIKVLMVIVPMTGAAIAWLLQRQFKGYDTRDGERAREVAALRERVADLPRLFVLRDDYLSAQTRTQGKLDAIYELVDNARGERSHLEARLDEIERHVCKEASQ